MIIKGSNEGNLYGSNSGFDCSVGYTNLHGLICSNSLNVLVSTSLDILKITEYTNELLFMWAISVTIYHIRN